MNSSTAKKGKELKYNNNYDEEAISNTEACVTRAAELGVRHITLARAIGVSTATVSGVLLGKYPSSPDRHLEMIAVALENIHREQISDGAIPYCDTSVSKLVYTVCEEARKHCKSDAIGLVCGRVGVGKTTALKHYTETQPGVIYIRAPKGMVKADALRRVGAALGIDSSMSMTLSRRQDMVMEALRGTRKLIILDEAQRPAPQVLEVFRDISDDTQTALVFAGREHLRNLFESNMGQFAEIASRILRWYPVVRNLILEDVQMMISAVYPPAAGSDAAYSITDDQHDAIIECSQLNGRVFEHLIGALKTYEENNGKVPDRDTITNIYEKIIVPAAFAWQGVKTQL